MPSSTGSTAYERGAYGEDLAASYLTGQGYRVVARNLRFVGGEIDLIAFDADVLCFVEVRSRANLNHGHPLETVGPAKIRRIVLAASQYLADLPEPWPETRFDVLGIVLSDPPAYTLVREAFEA